MESVRARILSISSLLLGLSMLLIGNSLQGTLLAVRGIGENFTADAIGVMALDPDAEPLPRTSENEAEAAK